MAEYGADQDELVEDYDDQVIEEENKESAEGQNKKTEGISAMHSTSFADYFLKPQLLRAITDNGFEHPSEVQQECIPKAMNGFDVLTQAKSGMGKTAIFVLAVLNNLGEKPDPLSCLVICHTRELAYQIQKEFARFSKHLPDLRTEVMYGGELITKHKKILADEPPHILVGTPGRILALVKGNFLKLDTLKFFILDECDKVLEQIDMRSDVQKIFTKTPHDKQVMMFSATLSKTIRPICRRYMRNPFEVFIDDESKLTLHGLQQYYIKLTEVEKNRKLSDLLDALLFNQVIIFVKTVARAIELDKLLNECNFPSVCIHRDLKQVERIKRFNEFKDFKQRIMVATNIFGRGIDIDRVNIVINYDMAESSDTYLHRVGRAGRFGTKGLAITFITTDDDKTILDDVQSRFEVSIKELPDQIDVTTYMNAQELRPLTRTN